jgi:hypothetical protein
MPVLRKADLIFEYTRLENGNYVGSLRAPKPEQAYDVVHEGVFTQAAWVQFVLQQILSAPKAPVVAFMLTKLDGEKRPHFLDPRTIEQIRVQSLTAEDFLL